MSTPLSALSTIISTGIFTIESTYAKHGATFPSLDEPFQPGPLDEDEALSTKIDHVIAAAAHLIALIKPAPRAVVENAFSVGDRIGRRSLFPLTFMAPVLFAGEPQCCYRDEHTRNLAGSRLSGLYLSNIQNPFLNNSFRALPLKRLVKGVDLIPTKLVNNTFN